MQLPRPRRPAGDAPPTNRPLSTYLHRRVELTDEVMRADELEELPAASVRVVPNKRAELDGVPIVDVVCGNAVRRLYRD